MPLHLSLFGSFIARSTSSNKLYEFRTNKVRALLAYLVMEHRKVHTRLGLASMLWPDLPEAKGLLNLRQTLHRMRQSMQEPVGKSNIIFSDRRTVGVEADELLWCDVLLFRQLVSATTTHTHTDLYSCLDCQTKLVKAVALYQGPFLEGFHIKNSFLFESWMEIEREQLHLQLVKILQALLHGYFQRKDYDVVAQYARQHTRIEPYQEVAWQYLILALSSKGDRAGALLVFEQCRQLFEDELGVSPSPELMEMGEALADTGMRPTLLPTNPYKGLQTFLEVDAAYFFGRENIVGQLVNKLEKFGFVAVVAPSGGGKSSVVRAGLLPRLRQEGWEITTIRPGNQPLHHLEMVFRERMETAVSPTTNNVEQPYILLVDQFEEIYATTISTAERQQFLKQLLDPQAIFSVVITLRADFIGNAISHRPLADALQTGTLLLGPMNQKELERAISEPARLHGAMFEGGLVKRLLHDVGTETGQLPLLQFTLLQLWESRENSQLTHIAYESIGRLEGALAKYADGVYEALTPTERQEARAIFLKLVQPEQHVADMRRPVSQTELTETQWQIVQRLTDARLLVTSVDNDGNGVAELVHEVLIRYWHRFQIWLTADHAFRIWLGRLQMLVIQWQAINNDKGVLLRGVPLTEAEKWLHERLNDLPTSAQIFIEASLQLRQYERELARRQQQRERSQKLALAAQLALFNNNPDEALKLAFEANLIDDPPIASQRILSEAAYAPGTRRRFCQHDAAVLDIALHPDGQHFLSASADGTVVYWDRERSDALLTFVEHEAAVHCVAIAPDGETAVSGDASGKILWWKISTGQILSHIKLPTDYPIQQVAILPDGTRFLSAGDDAIVRLWSLPDGKLLHEFIGHRDKIHCLAVSPDGQWAASGGADHDLFVWDIDERKQQKHLVGHPNILPLTPQLSGHYSTPFGVVFMPDGQHLLSASDAGNLFLWDINSGEITSQLNLRNSLRQIDVTPDGQTALIGTIDSQIILVDLSKNKVVLHLKGHNGRVPAVTFADAGQTALSASTDGEIRLWDLRHGAEEHIVQFSIKYGGIGSFCLSPNGEQGLVGYITGDMALWSRQTETIIRHWSGHEDMLFGGCHFSNDGKRAVSGSGDVYGNPLDSSVRVWDIATGNQTHCFQGHTSHVRAVAMAPNQQFVLSAGFDGKFCLWSLLDNKHRVLWDIAPHAVLAIAISPDSRWAVVGLGKGEYRAVDTALYLFDLQTGERVRQFEGHLEGVMGLAYAPDGSFFLSGGYDNTVRMWDVATGDCLHTLHGHHGNPMRIAISPSGRYAVSGGYDPILHLWDLERGGALRRWTGHTGYILSLDFTPDGKSVVSTASDDSIRTWRVDETQETLLQWAGEHRQLTIR